MNVQNIVNRARRLSFTSIGQYNDGMAMEDFNLVNKDLVNTVIQEVNENFFYDILKTTLVANQNEFILDPSVKKVDSVWVNYWTGFLKASEIAKSDVKRNYTELNEASESSPVFYIADNSIFLFPAAKEDITEWVKLDCFKKASDLAITDDETSILLEPEYHYIIAQWMLSFIFQQRGKINEKNDALIWYENLKSELVQQLTDRSSSPTVGLLPNLDYYA